MKLNIFFIIGLFLAVLNISCEKDDDNPGGETVPPRDRGEQEIDDQKALEAYLATHFYNYEDFESPSEGFDYTVRFDSIDEAHADKTPLIESELLERKTVTYDSVEYTLYILKIREGLGEQPTFADSTFVTYKGELLNGSLFDNAVTPIWFDLPGYAALNSNGRLVKLGGAIAGFAEALTEFKGASDFVVNSDNTVTWTNDYGIGAVFMPSGLGYFANPRTGIPAYSPLVFGFHLYSTNEADHDHDGIPSYKEDIDEDENLYNDDTDKDGFPNHSDPDDDGDFIPTREEIVINNDGSLEFPDEDGDGTPDYLDSNF